MKSEIIARLGQTDILLPSLIAEGLSANDRVKTRLSVLQAAGRHARAPDSAKFDLTDECHAAGLDTMAMELLVNRARLLAGELVTAPGLDSLGSAIWDDVATMIRAVEAGDKVVGEAARERLSAIRSTNEPESSDTLALAQIAGLTGISSGGSAGLHRLVMDLHRSLNGLAAGHAEEVLAGAHVYGLLPQDRPVIEAFMRGVEATRRLKFDHPGAGDNGNAIGHTAHHPE